MNKILVIFISLFMSSCSTNFEIINSSNVISIAVNLNDKDNSKIMQISSGDSIRSILTELNNAYPEPIKFYATHRIEITYATGKRILVLCSGTSMKVDGRTYKNKKKIRDILNYDH